MIKQTVTYTDFDDQEVTEDFYFNFTLLEIVEQIEVNKLEEKMDLLTKTQDGPGAYKIFKGIVLDAYGIKSPDGRQFHKSDEIRASFANSAAISELIIGFLQDEAVAITFIGGLLPKDKMDQALEKAKAKQSGTAGIQVPKTVSPAPSSARAFQQGQDEHTAASEEQRTAPLTPVPSDVTMTTAEKRQYTNEELESIAGTPGGVPPTPDNVQVHDIEGEPSDEQLLAMDARKMTPAQLQRAYALRTQQG